MGDAYVDSNCNQANRGIKSIHYIILLHLQNHHFGFHFKLTI